MSLRDLNMRLKRMEDGDGGSDAVLIYANGTHTGLQVRDALGLVCAAMRAESARLDGQEPTPSKYSAKLNLLRRAETCETSDGLIAMAHDVVRGGVE